MKFLNTILILFLVSSFSIFAQTDKKTILPEGYLVNPIQTAYGILATNENESSLYLINSGIEELISAPGCGRYIQLNKEGNKIGFKLINPENGLQSPAIYNLAERKVERIIDEVENAGQVSFAQDGKIAFTVDKQLFIKDGTALHKYNLGVYSNRTPISPDGNRIIFKDEDDQLWIFDLISGSKLKITDSINGYGNASWSPDGKFIVYTTTGTNILSYDVNKRVNYSIAEGENPAWSPDGKSIVFHRKEIDFNQVKILNSDIYVSNADGSTINQVTNTPDEIELDPKFSSDAKNIIYQNYSGREIKKLNVESTLQKSAIKSNIIFKSTEPIIPKFYDIKKNDNQTAQLDSITNWVHIHQVWDTRDNGQWHSQGEGYVCCGATTAMEVLASYGILKPWPFTTYGHNSNFGKYISEPYNYNGVTYNNFNGWPSGAHGFLWNGSGSPYSNTINYLRNHGITNTKRIENVYWSNVTDEINQGFPIIICTTSLTAAHIVLVIGKYGSAHTVVANDPYGDKNAGSYGQINNGEKALYDWSDANTGRYKITPVAWAITARYTPNATPEVLSFSPSSLTDSVKIYSSVVINFTTQMNKPTVENAFSIIPNVTGTFTWSDYDLTLTFKPDVPLSIGTIYTVKIDTSAKNIWNKSLNGEFVFEFVTKSRDRLRAVQIYPNFNQQEISPSVQFNITFDATVNLNALANNVFCYKSNGDKISLANVKVKAMNGKTYVSFDSKTPLEYNTDYKLFLYGKIVDTDGYLMKDTIQVNFKTEVQQQVAGTILDNLESIGLWNNPSFSGSTTGVDTLVSKFSISTSRKFNNLNSGKITYSFTQNAGGVCRVYDAAKPVIGSAADNTFGIWIYGDLSFNLLEYWFYDNANQNKTVFVDTLNWTGWKFKKVLVSQIEGNGDKQFHSVVIKQNENGKKTGEIYLDDVQLISATPVVDNNDFHSPSDYTLYQNYPNPFNPSTTIRYTLPFESQVKLIVYNAIGEAIRELVNTIQQAGWYKVEFSGSDLSSGIYFYTIKANSIEGNRNFNESKKLLFLK
ncbi:MAG: Ig-like domain-containing protein [Ignavibacteriales bacterium]|nr:Ig-like domain-containing protein [Ignavibacteriales bacterium]